MIRAVLDTNVVVSALLDADSVPADDRVLECALEFRADLLVTGNKSHFPRRYRRTLVVNPREFWEEYLLESGVR